MPTHHPRLTVTLTAESQQALSRLSAAGGGSQSSIVAELVLMASPTFERLATVLDLARKAKDSTRESLRADLAGSQAMVEGHLGVMTGELDRLMASMAEAGSGAVSETRQRPEPAPAAVSTPFSNRGVTTGRTRTPAPQSKAGRGKS